MFKSRIAKLAQLMVLGLGLGQVATADVTYSYLNQGVPPVVFKSVKLGHTNPNKIIHLNLNLAPADPGALEAYANSVSNPKSPNFHKFLTPAQVGAKFGQSDANFYSVVNYLHDHGFTIRLAAKNRFNILADATVSKVESTFKTVINDYQTLSASDSENQRFYSYASRLQIPSTLKGMIRSVSGLQNHSKAQPKIDALTPGQTRNLYGILPMYGSYKGEGRNVAITSFDGFLLSNVPVFLSAFGIPSPAAGPGTNIKVVTVDGGSQSGARAGEADLDIQMVLGQAPLCNFYIYDGGLNLIDVLAQEANDNLADIISESYGFNMSTDEALACHVVHLAMTTQGITYMGASGDSGTDLLGFDYPNFDPEVMKVGGTIASVNTDGTRTAEVVWSGSGSGWSTRTDSFNTHPSWQTGPGVPGGNNHRLFPDVALNASGNGTGAYQFVYEGKITSDYSGTSFACPVFAGGLAIAEQKLIALNSLPPAPNARPRFGRLQDIIYAQQGRPDVWFDIVDGPNTGALPDGTLAVPTKGWDFCTGWGAINFDAFVAAYATPPIESVPSAVAPYSGNYLSGDKLALVAVDGKTYDVATSEYSGIGQMAADKLTFTLPVAASKVLSISVSTTSSSHDLATLQIFVLNANTGSYDLIKSFTGSFAQTENKVSLPNASNYVSSTNQVSVVIRALAPDRLATGGFVLSSDQTKLIVQASP